MVTWIPSIYPLSVSIYTSTMDPSWVFGPRSFHSQSIGQGWSLHRWCCRVLPSQSAPPKAAVMASTRWRVEVPADTPSPQLLEQFLSAKSQRKIWYNTYINICYIVIYNIYNTIYMILIWSYICIYIYICWFFKMPRPRFWTHLNNLNMLQCVYLIFYPRRPLLKIRAVAPLASLGEVFLPCSVASFTYTVLVRLLTLRYLETPVNQDSRLP